MSGQTCHDCVHVYFDKTLWLSTLAGGWPLRPMCVNSVATPGTLRELGSTKPCRNFKAKRKATVRTELPEPPSEDIRYIALTRGKFAIVDAADFEELSQYKWHAMEVKGKFYARRSVAGGGAVLMHRQIMQPGPGMLVDHINGNGVDNRRSNMRECTPQQNGCNGRPREGSSQFKGVSRHGDKWAAQIMYCGEAFRLGLFDDEVAAAKARDAKAFALQGEFAYLNFPRDGGSG